MRERKVESYKELAAVLEAEVVELQERLRQTEADGAEIAQLAGRNELALREEIARLENRIPAGRPYCVGCKFQAMLLTIAWGGLFGETRFAKYLMSSGSDWMNDIGYFLAWFPVLFAAADWAVQAFCWHTAWVTWRNNDITRAIVRWLNG